MLRTFSLSLLCMTAAATAQDPLDADVPETRRYTVEMIVFSYAQNVSAGTEIFVADLPPADISPLQDSDDFVAPPLVDASEPEPVAQYEFTVLDSSDFVLDEIYGHLRRLDAYRPIAHFGWTQPTYPGEVSEAQPLSTFIPPPVGLDGDLNLYLNRYLHLVVNLQLDAPESQRQTYRFDNEIGDTYPVRFRIEEDRIFKNGDLRYFDHPKFGVLAKITRVEEAVISEDNLEDTELLGLGGE